MGKIELIQTMVREKGKWKNCSRSMEEKGKGSEEAGASLGGNHKIKKEGWELLFV